MIKVAVEEGRAYIVAPCGCAWRSEEDVTDIGTFVMRAVNHVREGEPCFIPGR